ncbi:MAG TPA: DUF1302 family protein [Thermodesulfobacteriota bacterium]|nr:DUF1302 family protein [Thermodesulfobacteriota bacterium]
MRTNIIILFFCIALIMGVATWASAIDDILGIPDLRFNGYLKNATAMRIQHDYDMMKIDNILDLRLTYEPKTLPFKFHIDLRPEYDGAYDMQHKGVGSDTGLEPRDRGIGVGRELLGYDGRFPGSLKGNLRENWSDSYMARTFLLRELWVDFRLGNLDLKLGKQQVAWGKTDGFKLLDILNPTDYREFILMDSEDSRIPIWMANIKYYFTPKHNVQFIWMPNYEPNFQALPGSIWALNPVNSVQLLGTAPFARVYGRNPDNQLKNSDFGFRYEGQIGEKFDFTINYLHRWDQNNVFPALVKISPTGLLIFLEEPKRQNIFGFSFTTTIDSLLGMKDVVLRGEFAYYKDRVFFENDVNIPIREDNIQAVIGFDKNVSALGKFWLVSLQLFENLIASSYPDHPISSLGGGKQKKHEENFTALVSTDFSNQRWKPEVLFIWSLSHMDGWVRPRVSYEISNSLTATAGFNILWGSHVDSLGQMSPNKQVFAELKWSW